MTFITHPATPAFLGRVRLHPEIQPCDLDLDLSFNDMYFVFIDMTKRNQW